MFNFYVAMWVFFLRQYTFYAIHAYKTSWRTTENENECCFSKHTIFPSIMLFFKVHRFCWIPPQCNAFQAQVKLVRHRKIQRKTCPLEVPINTKGVCGTGESVLQKQMCKCPSIFEVCTVCTLHSTYTWLVEVILQHYTNIVDRLRASVIYLQAAL